MSRLNDWCNRNEGIEYLAALPDHAMTAASQHGKYYDKGTRRPWGLDMYRAVWDQVREGKTELEIAFLFKRDLEDVRAVCRIINWMMKEMKVYV